MPPKTRVLFFTVLLLIGAFFLGRWLWERNRAAAPSGPPETPGQPRRPPGAPSRSASAPRERARPPIVNLTLSIPLEEEAPKPDARPADSALPFEVSSDGYAVAFDDILLGRPPADYAEKRGHYDAPKPRLWPTAEIPYLIDPTLPNPGRVEEAIEYLKTHTPIAPVPATATHADWIVFQPGADRCLSPLGQQGGGQPILLSEGCGPQEVLHEFLHSLGFVHEQSRWDRDDFVSVLWKNIAPEFHDQFAMVPESFMDTVRGAPFDFASVMLYRPDAFAKAKGLQTLKPKNPAQRIRRVAEGLSLEDRRRLYRLYRPDEAP